MLVRHQGRNRLQIVTNDGLNIAEGKRRRGASAQFAVALKDTKQGNLALATLFAARALPCVLVLLFAADECLISFDFPFQRAIERLGFDRIAQPVGHEPSRLLRDAQILGELGAGNALLVRRDQPDRQHP